MIRAADLLVCKAGGLIVSEALAAGVPLLIAQAIPGQETGNAEVVVQAGAGEMAADGLEALVAVCHWLEHDATLLAERSANARKLGRPDAAYNMPIWRIRRRCPVRNRGSTDYPKPPAASGKHQVATHFLQY